MLENNPQPKSIHSNNSQKEDILQEPLEPTIINYHGLEKIGSGAQGTLYRALNADDTPVAIKAFNIQNVDSLKDIELIEREINLLKSLQIHGIPKFTEYIQSDHHIYLVEEYIDAPSLKTLIQQNRRFSTEQLITILRNMAVILREFNQITPPVIHRDIKPANILVDENLNTYLVDFGVAASFIHKTIASTYAGTPGYIAPEQVYGKSTPASDIFSLGVTMIHLITGIDPCDMDIQNMSLDFDAHMPSNIPKWLTELLHRMTAPNVENRIQDGEELIRCIDHGEELIHSIDDRTVTPDPSTAPTESDDYPPVQNKLDIDIILGDRKSNLLNLTLLFSPKLSVYYTTFGMAIAILPILAINYITLLLKSPLVDHSSAEKVLVFDFCFMVFMLIFKIFSIIKFKLSNSDQEENNRHISTVNELTRQAILEQDETSTNRQSFDQFVNESRDTLLTDPEKTKALTKPLSFEENARLEEYLQDPENLHPCALFEPNLTKVNNINCRLIYFIIIFIIGILILLSSYIGFGAHALGPALLNIMTYICIFFLTFYEEKTYFSKLPKDIFDLYSRRFMRSIKIELDKRK